MARIKPGNHELYIFTLEKTTEINHPAIKLTKIGTKSIKSPINQFISNVFQLHNQYYFISSRPAVELQPLNMQLQLKIEILKFGDLVNKVVYKQKGLYSIVISLIITRVIHQE